MARPNDVFVVRKHLVLLGSPLYKEENIVELAF